MMTYGNGGGLCYEAQKVEAQLAMRGEGNTKRNHEHNHGEPLVRLLQAEGPRNEENGDRGEGLQ